MSQNIYFLGIGGIGMSALARYFKFKGYPVAGYDRTPSNLTRSLEREGISVHYEDRPDLIPSDREHTIIIYTPAIPESLGEMRLAREGGYTLLKRAEMLGRLTGKERCLAVAGTHGKTTTSTLVAHILTESGRGCSAFLGGISKNYGTNLLTGSSNEVVVEADEYDRSFLHLHPAIAAITAMDADHLDVYGDVETMRDAYRSFASNVSEILICKQGLPLRREVTAARMLSYSMTEPQADFHAGNIRLDPDGHYSFDIVHPEGIIRDVRCGVLGKLNVENSIAAAAICLSDGLEPDKTAHAISTFKGVKRRMEEHLNGKVTYIDDYAHHPAELEATIRSIREMFPSRKLTAVFQPHLYSRTRDFAPEFAAALSLCDQVVLCDIYPAREEPIPGVDSNLILNRVTSPQKGFVPYCEIPGWVDAHKEELDVLVTFGAGNIDRLVDPITEALQ